MLLSSGRKRVDRWRGFVPTLACDFHAQSNVMADCVCGKLTWLEWLEITNAILVRYHSGSPAQPVRIEPPNLFFSEPPKNLFWIAVRFGGAVQRFGSVRRFAFTAYFVSSRQFGCVWFGLTVRFGLVRRFDLIRFGGSVRFGCAAR